jgi:GST-like protein
MEEPGLIKLYFWPTPNGYKISILLEELGLPYEVEAVHIGKGEQFNAEFLKISPNNKIPAIVDPSGPDGTPYALFESAAIMMYLAEKSGFRFMPANMKERYEVLQWLSFQAASMAPMLGQAHHFREYAKEKIPYAVDRFTSEAARLYRVLEQRWYSAVRARPAVQRGLAVLKERFEKNKKPPTGAAWDNLFGNKQFAGSEISSDDKAIR